MMCAGEQEMDLEDTQVRSAKLGVRLRVCDGSKLGRKGRAWDEPQLR